MKARLRTGLDKFGFFCLALLPFVLAAPSFAAPAASEWEFSIDLTVSPDVPYPGDTVKIQAKVSPDFDEKAYGIRWKWIGGAGDFRKVSADIPGAEAVAYEALYASTTVSATLWDRTEGHDLATASLTVTPKEYALSVRNLTPEETVRLWSDEAKALSDVQGRQVKSRVVLEGMLEPRTLKKLRYLWIPNEGSIVVSQDGNRAVAYRDVVGEASVLLRVLDSNNVELGKETVSFDVNISLDDLERSRLMSRGWGRWQSALALRERGAVNIALVQAQQAIEELTAGGMRSDALRGELARFRQLRDDYFRALEIASVAASLWRDGKLQEALSQFRRAQGLYVHAEVEKNIAELEGLVKQEAELKEKAALLAREAERSASEERLEEAIDRYKESLRLVPDPGIRAALADTEGRLAAMRRKIELAEMMRAIGLNLESQDDLEGAVARMTEARNIWTLPGIASDLDRIRNKLLERRRRQDMAMRLSKEASALESKGLEEQGDPEILSQALNKYQEAMNEWPDVSTERSVMRVTEHITRIQGAVTRAVSLVKEAEMLRSGENLEEALDKYHQAQDQRRSDASEREIVALERHIKARDTRIREARGHHIQAQVLERQEKLDEALKRALQGEGLLTSADRVVGGSLVNDLAAAVKRLQNAVAIRDGKISRAAELAARARQEEDLEKALDLFIESENIWHDEKVAQEIRTLQGRRSENRDTERRAADLYKEALALDRESKLEEAEEKLQLSLTLRSLPETEKLLQAVRARISEKTWIEALQAQPLTLRAIPALPRTGERTTLRISNGAWTTDENLEYHWKLVGNVRGGAPLERGRVYAFYPADDQPVTAELTVVQAKTDRILATQILSVTAELRFVKLTPNEKNKMAKLWNISQKRLEEVREFPTGTDIEIRAEAVPLPEGVVSYLWSADKDSVVTVSRDNKAEVRRTVPGTSRIAVTLKDAQDIVLGGGELSLLVAVDKNDIARDFQRAQAWGKWTAAQELWNAGERLQAIHRATEAALLDPLEPDLTYGLSQMKDDLGKMERATQLLSDASFLLAKGDIDPAGEKIGEARKLWSDERIKDLEYIYVEASEKVRRNTVLAAKLRTEGDALLVRGSKIEALLRFQDSLLLEKNDATSKEVARLVSEIDEERQKFEEAHALRAKASTLVERRRYTEALELFEQSRALYTDAYLETYAEMLKERVGEEKIARAEAQKLREEGDALMKDKKVVPALEKYKESLRIWRDDDLSDLVDKEESRIARETAASLRRDAERLVKEKKSAEALAKYKESLTYAHNDAAANFVQRAEAAEAKKRAEALIKEGDAFVKQKKPEEALVSYRLALTKTPKDEALIEKIRVLEQTLIPAVMLLSSDVSVPEEPEESNITGGQGDSRDLVQADALYKEGNALYRQKKYREALEKYRESTLLSQNQKLKEFTDQLETALLDVEQANKLVQEGNVLYKNQKHKEALSKYRESLQFNKNAEVESFILKIEAQLK